MEPEHVLARNVVLEDLGSLSDLERKVRRGLHDKSLVLPVGQILGRVEREPLKAIRGSFVLANPVEGVTLLSDSRYANRLLVSDTGIILILDVVHATHQHGH